MTDTQKQQLAALRTAANEAVERGQVACLDNVPDEEAGETS